VIDQLIEIINEVYQKRDRISPVYIKMYKEAFDGLVKEGFTEDQALKLLKAMKFTG
jgi:hypothetical protein